MFWFSNIQNVYLQIPTSIFQLQKFQSRARSSPVEYVHGMDEKGVQFPSGPPFAPRLHSKLRSGKPLNFAGDVWIVLKKGAPNEAESVVGL